jgi:hypothetical protein
MILAPRRYFRASIGLLSLTLLLVGTDGAGNMLLALLVQQDTSSPTIPAASSWTRELRKCETNPYVAFGAGDRHAAAP